MPSQPQARFFDAPALLVQARFRERTLSACLLEAGATRGFTVGAGRAADAPVDVAYLPASRPANDNHVLVQPTGAGFLINLPEAMRARLQESATHLRVPCGEVVFDITAAAAAPAVPRPWLSRRWKQEGRYLAGVAAGVLLLLGAVSAVPSDPRAISLDDVGRMIRMDRFRVAAPEPAAPPPAPRGAGSEGGGAAPAAAGPEGAAGDPKARPRDTRRAPKGPARNQDARDAVAFVTTNSLLSVLGTHRTTILARVLAPEKALGDHAQDVLGHLVGPEIADAYNNGGLGQKGTGARGGGTGDPTLPGSGLGTGPLGRIPGGPGRGTGPSRGDQLAALPGRSKLIVPDVILTHPTVKGALDKEIIRRVVRTHLNEVRFCYEQSLVRRPSLSGRVVVQFSIAPTGRVLASALQSSSIADPALNSCIVDATRRWSYPAPEGGGLAIVSYPFQLSPAGG
jgi:TonB family protein